MLLEKILMRVHIRPSIKLRQLLQLIGCGDRRLPNIGETALKVEGIQLQCLVASDGGDLRRSLNCRVPKSHSETRLRGSANLVMLFH